MLHTFFEGANVADEEKIHLNNRDLMQQILNLKNYKNGLMVTELEVGI